MKKMIICKTEFIDLELTSIYLHCITDKLNEAHMKIKFEAWYICLAHEVNALIILQLSLICIKIKSGNNELCQD